MPRTQPCCSESARALRSTCSGGVFERYISERFSRGLLACTCRCGLPLWLPAGNGWQAGRLAGWLGSHVRQPHHSRVNDRVVTGWLHLIRCAWLYMPWLLAGLRPARKLAVISHSQPASRWAASGCSHSHSRSQPHFQFPPKTVTMPYWHIAAARTMALIVLFRNHSTHTVASTDRLGHASARSLGPQSPDRFSVQRRHELSPPTRSLVAFAYEHGKGSMPDLKQEETIFEQ